MQNEEIQRMLEQAIADSRVTIENDGSHYSVVVVAPQFEGLSKVKRQQAVYAVLNDIIASGDVHAVHMQTYTPQEFAALDA